MGVNTVLYSILFINTVSKRGNLEITYWLAIKNNDSK